MSSYLTQGVFLIGLLLANAKAHSSKLEDALESIQSEEPPFKVLQKVRTSAPDSQPLAESFFDATNLIKSQSYAFNALQQLTLAKTQAPRAKHKKVAPRAKHKKVAPRAKTGQKAPPAKTGEKAPPKITKEIPSEGNELNLLRDSGQILSNTANDLYELIDSPALRHALSAGTFAANTAVTNAMDALFYSLLDRTWPLNKSRFTTLETGIERNLTRLPDKSYLVIDRVMIGPRMSRQIIPAAPFGIGAAVAAGSYFYEFYLTHDAERLNEGSRNLKNKFSAMNWFGILPFLTRILPPSFDPNELYNPMRVFSVPLKVPLNRKHLQEMQENTIRSYAIKGTVSFPMTHAWLQEKLPSIAKKTALAGSLPIYIYANAEARVSVHKQSENQFKISLSNIQTEGSNIGLEIGKMFYAFGLKASEFTWKGVPVAIFPLRMSFDTHMLQEHTLVRNINLNEDIPDEALAKALTGNFNDLDLSCLSCKRTDVYKSGTSRLTANGFSGFFLDTKSEARRESTDYSISRDKLNVNFSETRHESNSVSWDIMNGATTANATFAWSTPTQESGYGALIWNKFSLSIPSVDENNFQDTTETLSIIGLTKKPMQGGTISQAQLVFPPNRSRESLIKMMRSPAIYSSQQLFSGPRIIGDLDLIVDLFASQDVVTKIAKIPAIAIARHLGELGQKRRQPLEKGFCKDGFVEKFTASIGTDFCEVKEDEMKEIEAMQGQILKNFNNDLAKDAQANFINKIGSLGFIYLVTQTQSENDYQILVNMRCRPHSAAVEELKQICALFNQPLTLSGNLPLSAIAWWKDLQNEKSEGLVNKVESLEVLNINNPENVDSTKNSSANYLEIHLNESAKGPLSIYIRLESFGELDIARNFLFENVYETNLPNSGAKKISIPKSFFEQSNQAITSFNPTTLRIKVSVSRDGKTWSKLKTLSVEKEK